MTANYHTHTARCRHAVGDDRAYVERAIQGGLQVLGFSDHAPYPFPGGYRSDFRMEMGELEGYVSSVLDLKREYRDDIRIHLGLEVEYYPALFPQLLRVLEGFPIEYFLLGQHYLGNEQGAPYSGAATADPAVLKGYCDQVIAGIETGCYTYLAHPDLIHFCGDEALYDSELRRLCRAANRWGLPLEINFLGLWQGRHYPDERFWRIAGQEGCRAIFGCDAHDPLRVWDPPALDRARALAARWGLAVLDRAALRDPLAPGAAGAKAGPTEKNRAPARKGATV